jgi:hypothetical protein
MSALLSSMARQIVIEMVEADKFLRDWHPAEGD